MGNDRVSSTTTPSVVQITGFVSFPSSDITQEHAEMAVVKTLAEYTGLLESSVEAEAGTAEGRRLGASRRLSNLWRVVFALRPPAAEEERVRGRLEELLADTPTYAQSLREALSSMGSVPADDFPVTVALDETAEAPPSEDLPVVVIIAAITAVVALFAALIYKACQSKESAAEADSRGYSRTDLPEGDDDELPALASLGEDPSSKDVASPISSLEVFAGGSTRDLQVAERLPGFGVEASSKQAENEEAPPMPPPAEPPEALPAVEADVCLSDVRLPQLQASGQPQSNWILVEADLSQRTCQFLSPSTWSGTWKWTDLSRIQRSIVPTVQKEYNLTFQRGGRLVGLGNEDSGKFRLTGGRYHAAGEVEWREVPLTVGGFAFECTGHLRVRRRKDGTGGDDSFEIVGLFTAFDTSISAQQVGSGRFALHARPGLQPTAIGAPASYFAADCV